MSVDCPTVTSTSAYTQQQQRKSSYVLCEEVVDRSLLLRGRRWRRWRCRGCCCCWGFLLARCGVACFAAHGAKKHGWCCLLVLMCTVAAMVARDGRARVCALGGTLCVLLRSLALCVGVCSLSLFSLLLLVCTACKILFSSNSHRRNIFYCFRSVGVYLANVCKKC